MSTKNLNYVDHFWVADQPNENKIKFGAQNTFRKNPEIQTQIIITGVDVGPIIVYQFRNLITKII